LCLCGVFLLLSCGPHTAVQKAGGEQEVARDISWELRKDPRFGDVNVYCTEGVVTLQGRVDTKVVEQDAIRVATYQGRGARVVSKLVIRPR
jgi:osmotically-inducible protein OsmY